MTSLLRLKKVFTRQDLGGRVCLCVCVCECLGVECVCKAENERERERIKMTDYLFCTEVQCFFAQNLRIFLVAMPTTIINVARI